MTQPFGIAVSAVGIPASYTACVDCFEYIQFGRQFGQDFQRDLLTLNCVRIRLTRWGEAVNIYKDPKLGRPDTTTNELQVVKNALQGILVLFEKIKKNSEKYKQSAKAGEDLSAYTIGDMDTAAIALDIKMKRLATKRQKGSSPLKTTSWVLYQRSDFRELVGKITELIDSLEKAFPAPKLQKELSMQEAAEIRDKQALGLVESAAQTVDRVLYDSAKEALTGHRYSNVTIKGKGLVGDLYVEGWKGAIVEAFHEYISVEVAKDASVVLGNQHGGKGFWDD